MFNRGQTEINSSDVNLGNGKVNLNKSNANVDSYDDVFNCADVKRYFASAMFEALRV